MLGFLTVAGLLGVASVFSPTDFGGRMVGSSCVVALACALFLPVLPRREGYALLLSGKVWMVVVVLIALGGLALIWNDTIGRPMREETIAMSQVLLALGMFAAITPLKVLEHSVGKFRPVCKASLLITGGVTGLCIGALLFSNFAGGFSGNRIGELFSEWLVLVVGGIAGVACAAGWIGRRQGTRGIVPIVGIVVIIACIASWQEVIFHSWAGGVPPLGLKYALLLTGLSVAIAIHSIAVPMPLGRIERRLIPYIAIGAALMGVLAFLLARDVDDWNVNFYYGRILAAVGIVEACLVLTLGVLWQLGRRAVRPWTVSGAEVTCPRCGKRSNFAIGESPCSTCGFRVLIAFRDVCCAKCKHDVRTLEPGHPCPECGHEVERSSERYLNAGTAGATGAAASG